MLTGNPDELHGMINFFKRQNAGMVIDKFMHVRRAAASSDHPLDNCLPLLQFQSVAYDIVPDKESLTALAHINILDERLCFKLSQRVLSQFLLSYTLLLPLRQFSLSPEIPQKHWSSP